MKDICTEDGHILNASHFTKVYGSSVFHNQYPEYSYKFKDPHQENIVESQTTDTNIESKSVFDDNFDSTHQDIHGLSQLVLEAELVHTKLNRILSDYYFRIYQINLDSRCRNKTRSNSCSSQKNFINLSKNGFNSQQNLMDNQNGSQCSPMNGNNTHSNSNGTTRENGSGIQKCHVDRCNSSDIPFNIMGSKKENYVLRFSESSLNKNVFTNFGFTTDFLGLTTFVSDNVTFVDLLRNPPSYTGYNGQEDWKLIYTEIDKFDNLSCKENLHFYKLISGMQTSIAAFSSLNYECTNPSEAYENQTELPRYQSNFQFYSSRLSTHKDWIDNLYYTYRYVLSAVVRLRDYLSYYNSNLQLVNNELHLNLKDFLKYTYKLVSTTSCDCNFNRCNNSTGTCVEVEDPSPDCCNPNLIDPKCGSEILDKFNKLIQLLDCVDCEKCRLHGKLKLSAIRTAIKILSCPSDQLNDLELTRNDLVSLLHGLDYFAQSVLIIERFEQYKKRQIMLYPLRFLIGCMLAIIVIYRKEIIKLTCGLKPKLK